MKKIKLPYKLTKNVHKLLFLLWVISPFIPIALLWTWLSPVGFWQSFIMFIACVVLYGVFLLGELVLVIMFVEY